MSDFPGPFFGTWNQSQYVDFSTLVTSAAYTIVTPLNLENSNDIWAFVKPFDYWVWINFFISVPCFILILGMADYVARGKIIFKSLHCRSVQSHRANMRKSALPPRFSLSSRLQGTHRLGHTDWVLCPKCAVWKWGGSAIHHGLPEDPCICVGLVLLCPCALLCRKVNEWNSVTLV